MTDDIPRQDDEALTARQRAIRELVVRQRKARVMDANALIQDLQNIAEIQRLLDEAYDHFFEHAADTHSKMSEGAVSVSFGTYWDRKSNPDRPPVEGVMVYSYVFGPHRAHDFGTTAEALAAVRDWHRRAMAHDYCGEDLMLPVEKLLTAIKEDEETE